MLHLPPIIISKHCTYFLILLSLELPGSYRDSLMKKGVNYSMCRVTQDSKYEPPKIFNILYLYTNMQRNVAFIEAKSSISLDTGLKRRIQIFQMWPECPNATYLFHSPFPVPNPPLPPCDFFSLKLFFRQRVS